MGTSKQDRRAHPISAEDAISGFSIVDAVSAIHNDPMEYRES